VQEEITMKAAARSSTRSRLTQVAAACAIAAVLSACGGNDDDTTASGGGGAGGGGGGGGGGAGGPAVSGMVAKGPVAGSTVTVFALNADGSLGASLGSAATDSAGAFAVTLSSAPSGAVVLVAAGGTYVSEVDGATVTKVSDLSAILGSVPAGGASGVVVTPLSDMAAARARAIAGGGGDLTAALTAAESLVKSTYGIGAGTSLLGLAPTYAKATLGTEGYLLGLVLGSLDKCDAAVPALRGALFSALSADFSDGVFDGKKAGAAITIGTGTTALSSTAGTSDFLSCVSGYVASGKALIDAGVTAADVAPATATLRTAVAGSTATPKSTGLSASSSGAISSLAFGGKQWIFIAARASGVVAIDVTDPTVAAPPVKVFSSLVATNFAGKPIGGVVPLQGADHPQLLIFAYGSKHIALINADTGVVEFEADLPLVATSPVGFSGGSAFIAGAIPDTGRDGAWLATADGYVFFDRVTRTMTTSYALGTGSFLAENLGGDIGHNLLFAPNYTPAVQLVDLAAAKSYYFEGTPFRTAFPTLGTPDAGSVDTGLQVGIITNEDTDDVGFINLKTIVKTDVAGGKSTFVAGAGGTALLALNSPTLSGSAVDSDTHLALFMAGFSSDIAVGMIQDPASVPAGGTWVGMTDWRYVNNLPGYAFARDPHAVAVIKNLGNSKAYGYLLDGGAHKAFQIDIAAVLAATPLGTTGSDAHRVDPTSAAIVAAVKPITW